MTQQTNATHTPGPWSYGQRSDNVPGTYFYVFGDAREELDIEDDHVADVMTAANARLIAAAPDLLEAARAVLLDLERFTRTQGPGPDKRLTALIEAITKAEGGNG